MNPETVCESGNSIQRNGPVPADQNLTADNDDQNGFSLIGERLVEKKEECNGKRLRVGRRGVLIGQERIQKK